jgi:hypothetical protein
MRHGLRPAKKTASRIAWEGVSEIEAGHGFEPCLPFLFVFVALPLGCCPARAVASRGLARVLAPPSPPFLRPPLLLFLREERKKNLLPSLGDCDHAITPHN